MYYDGEGVKRDYNQAAHWYQLAAKQGVAIAQHSLAEMYHYGIGLPQNHDEALKWYRLAAEKRYVLSEFALGEMYEKRTKCSAG